jgi:glycosyltransferase involved in cell wall biosynthesis
MGKVVPPRNSSALAEAILEVLTYPERFHGDQAVIRRRYAAETVAAAYENIFDGLVRVS